MNLTVNLCTSGSIAHRDLQLTSIAYGRTARLISIDQTLIRQGMPELDAVAFSPLARTVLPAYSAGDYPQSPVGKVLKANYMVERAWLCVSLPCRPRIWLLLRERRLVWLRFFAPTVMSRVLSQRFLALCSETSFPTFLYFSSSPP